MITGWLLTALILALSGAILEFGRKRQQRMLSASAAVQFALSTTGGGWSVEGSEAIRALPSGHRVHVRRSSLGWEADLMGFTASLWLPVAMVRGRKVRAEEIVDDKSAFRESFIPWDEGDSVRLERFKDLTSYREVRVEIRNFYANHDIIRFVSTATRVSIAIRTDDASSASSTDAASATSATKSKVAEDFVEAAARLMSTLERARIGIESNATELPSSADIVIEGHLASTGGPTGAPVGIPGVDE